MELPYPQLRYINHPSAGPREVAWFGTVYNPIASDQSEGWQYATDQQELHFSDPSRKVRVANTTEYIVWETPGLIDMQLDVYAEDLSFEDHLTLAVSDNGITWYDVKLEVDRVAQTPTGLHHLKITGRSPVVHAVMT